MSYFNAKEELREVFEDYLDSVILNYHDWCMLCGLKEDCRSSWISFIENQEYDVFPKF